MMRHRLVAVCAAALPVVSGAITAGWDNVNPARSFPTPKKVYWRADLSKWPDAFTVEWKDGAEGRVTLEERKLCRYLCQEDDGGTNVTPVIVVAGDRSVSRWENWGVEDLEGAKEGWREFVKRTAPPDRSGDQQPLDRFEADLAAEPDHVARVERRDGTSVLLVDGREAAPVMFKGLGSRAGKVPFACRVRNLRTGKPEPVSDGTLPLDLVAGETCWFAFEP